MGGQRRSRSSRSTTQPRVHDMERSFLRIQWGGEGNGSQTEIHLSFPAMSSGFEQSFLTWIAVQQQFVCPYSSLASPVFDIPHPARWPICSQAAQRRLKMQVFVRFADHEIVPTIMSSQPQGGLPAIRMPISDHGRYSDDRKPPPKIGIMMHRCHCSLGSV